MEQLKSIQAQKGKFYTIGVGPGAMEYLTLKALRLIQTADVIIAPRSKISNESLALQTVAPFIKSNQIIYEHVYSMSRDEESTLASWREVAVKVEGWLKENKSVVHITIGDPFIYSTTHYLLSELEGRVDQNSIAAVPGISAFQTIASKFLKPLTIQEGRLMIMTGTDMNRVEKALGEAETLVLYKCGKSLEDLTTLLEKKNLIHKAKLVCYADQEGKEIIMHDLREVRKSHPGYMATVIIYKGELKWN